MKGELGASLQFDFWIDGILESWGYQTSIVSYLAQPDARLPYCGQGRQAGMRARWSRN